MPEDRCTIGILPCGAPSCDSVSSTLLPVTPHPTLADVRAAAERIADLAPVTPVRRSEWLSEAARVPVWLKLECEQQTGSFKVRGAANVMLQLTAAELGAGVVAVSSGNHGRAIAYVARSLGVAATICISERVPEIKVDAIRALGAVVVVAGPDQDDADAADRKMVEARGLTFVHTFDAPRVIAGQGTIGLEITDQVPDLHEVWIPLSGGGLAGGIALASKGVDPSLRVVGISQDRGPAMVRTMEAGHLVDVVEEDTLADALAGGLGPVNHHSVHLCSTLLDATHLVSEDEMAAAMAYLYREEGLTVEGGGSVGVAALLSGKLVPDGPAVFVISGGNVGQATIEQVMQR
jgi:threonine dehydratase